MAWYSAHHNGVCYEYSYTYTTSATEYTTTTVGTLVINS